VDSITQVRYDFRMRRLGVIDRQILALAAREIGYAPFGHPVHDLGPLWRFVPFGETLLRSHLKTLQRDDLIVMERSWKHHGEPMECFHATGRGCDWLRQT
jgi:hypothetical protein